MFISREEKIKLDNRIELLFNEINKIRTQLENEVCVDNTNQHRSRFSLKPTILGRIDRVESGGKITVDSILFLDKKLNNLFDYLGVEYVKELTKPE